MSRTAPASTQLAAVPAALLRYQQQWVSERADVAVWEKSRRVGASWCDASDSVLFSASEGGQDSMYIGYSEDMTREYIDDCAMWAKAFNMAAGAVAESILDDTDDDGGSRKIKAFRIDFANGCKILALSSRPRSIRGKQGKITIDEAAFHDDLAGLLKAALAMLIWGGRVRIISSHNGAENLFNEIVLGIRAGKLPYALHRTTFDDALADGLYRRVCLKSGKAWSAEGEAQWRADIYARYRDNADEELDCIPSNGTGVWLPRALIEARMVPGRVLRYTGVKGMSLWPEERLQSEIRDWCDREMRPELNKLDGHQRSVFGVDFGRHVDLSVFVPMQISATLKRRVPFTIELSNVPYKAQEQILFYMGDRLPLLSAAKLDTGGNGDYLGEQAQHRYGEHVVEKVKLSETWYRENTGPMKADLEDEQLELVRDADTVNDLASFRIIRGVPRIPDLRTTSAGGGKRHGDAGIAHLLAHAASRADYYPIEHFSSGEPRVSSTIHDYF